MFKYQEEREYEAKTVKRLIVTLVCGVLVAAPVDEGFLDLNVRVLGGFTRYLHFKSRGFQGVYEARDSSDLPVMMRCMPAATTAAYCYEAARIGLAIGRNKIDEEEWVEMLILAAEHASFSKARRPKDVQQ